MVTFVIYKRAATVNRGYNRCHLRYDIIILVSRANEPHWKERALDGKHKMIKLVDRNEGEMSFRSWDSERSIVLLFNKETIPEIKFIEKSSCNRVSYCGNEARRVTKPPERRAIVLVSSTNCRRCSEACYATKLHSRV